MSDNYLTNWKPWKVRAAELKKLQVKDRSALDTFYFRNYSYLKSFVVSYYQSRGKAKHFYNVEDMLQDAYLDFFADVDFSSPSYFQTSLKSSMYYSAFGGRWNRKAHNAHYVHTESRASFFRTCTALDELLILGGESPHAFLMKERERRRQEKLEDDLEVLLRQILTPRQFDLWLNCLDHEIKDKLRRHSGELLQFLREHGTPERKLQGRVMTAEEERARIAERKARLSWEEDHLEELSVEKRREVIQRIQARERARRRRLERKK